MFLELAPGAPWATFLVAISRSVCPNNCTVMARTTAGTGLTKTTVVRGRDFSLCLAPVVTETQAALTPNRGLWRVRNEKDTCFAEDAAGLL